ncbi:MAG: DUF1080 domain-containing protein [bacterium]|nr:DUF1080 domain-containing protein [bacterium]
MRSLLPLFLTVLALSTSAAAQTKTRVLLVSGANNHDWEWTTPSLARILRDAGIEVDVTYEPKKTLSKPEHLAKYSAFVLDYNGPRWGDEAEASFLAAVESGTGVAVIHAANNAFEGWVEYEKLVGHMWRKGTGHGKFHAFDVRITDNGHPITRGLPDLIVHPDELYHDLVAMHGADHRVLAVAHSSSESGGTGADEPMIFVSNYGEGRVFHTPLGHVWKGQEPTRASHQDPQFHTLLVRGVQWAATGRVDDGARRPNRLTENDRRVGWRLLFDGRTTRGWRGYNKEGFPDKGWFVQGGCLYHAPKGGGGDIITDALYGDFELEFEWKTARGANSGVKYRLEEKQGSPTAPEYQVLDDAGGGEGNRPLQSAGSLYAVHEPDAEKKELAPTGSFNHSRILARGGRIEHWLNGKRIVTTEVGSDDWKARVAKSKFKNAAGYGEPKRGHILFQDHGDEVWFRSIKLRDFSALDAYQAPIFDGSSLSGWREVGNARWSVDDDCIVGEVGGGGQSFLVTEESFGDFILETDVKFEVLGNSGIQIRSHQRPNGQVYGYQIEIDSSPRAWSGGLYDEGRRAWLDNLDGDNDAKAAFDNDGWNRYRIECVGARIQVWVNGIQTADYLDAEDLEGFIGLQVHSGRKGTIRWRHPRVWRLGRQEWAPLFDGRSLEQMGPANGAISFPDRTWEGRWAATEGAYTITRDSMRDATLRVRFQQDTGLLATSLQTHADAHGPPTEQAKWTPTDLGLVFRPAGSKSYKDGRWNELVVAMDGDRVAAILNGDLIDEMREAPLPESFRWAILLPWKDGAAGNYFLQNIDRLVIVE